MSGWTNVGDTLAAEKDDEEATSEQRGHPRGQQSVRDLRAISVTPGPGNGGASIGAPRRGIPSPRATPPSLLYQRCVGMAAQGRGFARQPNGPERLEGLTVWNAEPGTLMVSKHHLPFNLSLAPD